jgi:hypothetical protein
MLGSMEHNVLQIVNGLRIVQVWVEHIFETCLNLLQHFNRVSY